MQNDCLNCNAPFAAGQVFCPYCGQKTNVRRLTVSQLLGDFGLMIIKIEKGVVRLLKGLFRHPGTVANEYIAGRRKKYINPFGFMTLCVAFTLLINNWLRPYGSPPEPDPKVLSRIYTEETKQKYLRTIERNARVLRISNKNMNLVSVAAAPFYAVFLFWFFRRRGRNIAEIIVAYILFAAFSNVISTIIFSPVLAALRDHNSYYYIQVSGFTLQTAYMAWGMRDFFGYKGSRGFVKIMAALSVIGIIGFILLVTAYFLYVFYGSYEVLRYI